MKIYEYQAKRILKEYGLQVLNGYLIEDLTTSERQVRKIETSIAVVKAQIYAGGRGKAGGIRLVKSLDEAIQASAEMIGKRLVTKQTGEEGVLVRKVYIEEGCSVKHEYYLSLVLDSADGGITIIGSREGGMDIEEIADSSPEQIFRIKVDPLVGLTDYQIRAIIYKLDIPKEAFYDMQRALKGVYRCFIDKDCTMVEINPLVLTEDMKIVPLDAKMIFDDNALFRHPEILELKDETEEDPKELEAAKYNLSYVALDGSIGCLVNGAGLALATMDSINTAGGNPANFLDVGGSASTESIDNAFRLILSDSRVKGIFVNIFGGIMACDLIANGIIQARQTIDSSVPIVVRLEGTNEEKGKAILDESKLNFYTVDSMDEGARLIVKLVTERGESDEYLG